jgi:hypothetical protein
MQRAAAPAPGKGLLDEVRRVSFGYFPEKIPAATPLRKETLAGGETVERLSSEEHIEFQLRYPNLRTGDGPKSVFLAVLNEDEAGTTPEWVKQEGISHRVIVLCEPRGIGATRWTRKNPPNYVERSHALLGRTVDAGRMWDVIAAARFLSGDDRAPVYVAGKGAAGVIAGYAAALDDRIAGATLLGPPKSHMDSGAPQLLNVLRVCDVPIALGMIAPRPLTLIGVSADDFASTKSAYAVSEKAELTFK